MCKDTIKNGINQEKNLFLLRMCYLTRKNQVDFRAPDISSNGGLMLVGLMKDSIARKIAHLIPDYRNQPFVQIPTKRWYASVLAR